MTRTLTPAIALDIFQCPQSVMDQCYDHMVSAMLANGIETPEDILCFFVQADWESGGLVNFTELGGPSYFDMYNNRSDLGNGPTDGYPFRGAGPIQVTGRFNFQAVQDAMTAAGIQIDIMSNTDLLRSYEWGFWASCWWWKYHTGNTIAEVTPLYEASIECGRLVNEGDPTSPYTAQGEQGRIDAFNRLVNAGYTDLALPGSVPPTPPLMAQGAFMSLTDAQQKEMYDVLHSLGSSIAQGESSVGGEFADILKQEQANFNLENVIHGAVVNAMAAGGTASSIAAAVAAAIKK
jgi:predicted chitinase